MTELQNYSTVNSNSQIVVAMAAVSHVIEHNNKEQTDSNGNMRESCWIHFHSSKSVHVNVSFEEVKEDLAEFYKVRG